MPPVLVFVALVHAVAVPLLLDPAAFFFPLLLFPSVELTRQSVGMFAPSRLSMVL